MQVSPEIAVAQTRRWIESIVIGLGLCPFAREVLRGGRVRFALSRARDATALLRDLDREITHLVSRDSQELDTTLLVHPYALLDFLDFNDFLDPAEALVRERGLESVLQIASFHPGYRFADAPVDDPANYSNRSPHPVLHLLRESSVMRAIETHPDALGIPARNAALLRELGGAAMRDRLEGCRKRAADPDEKGE